MMGACASASRLVEKRIPGIKFAKAIDMPFGVRLRWSWGSRIAFT